MFLPIPLHDGLCRCVILQAVNNEALKELGKALEESKTLEKLTLNSTELLPKDFCRQIVFGTRHNASLSKIDLTFHPKTWDFPNNGR